MTEKNLRSCIKYCSKSLYLLQSEGGCLPIEHPLERGKDGLTVRSECVFYVSADASFRRRCAAFRALLGVGRRGAAGAGKRPQPYCGEKVLQRVIRGKMRVFASGERGGRFCANFYVFRAIDERIQLPNGVLVLVSLLSGHREDGLALTFTGQSTSLGNRVLVVLPDCGLPREFDSSCLPGAVGLPNVLG